MPNSARTFFSDEEQWQILEAIRDAEAHTSGEIRVHLEMKLSGDVLDRAAYLFRQLKMDDTEVRNGVLIYLAVRDRKFAVIGDAGINAVVPEGFWDKISAEMSAAFREGRFADGLSHAIREAGEQLKAHFPHMEDDINELSDEISFGAH